MESSPPMPEDLVRILAVIYVLCLIIFIKCVRGINKQDSGTEDIQKANAKITGVYRDYSFNKRNSGTIGNTGSLYILSVTFQDSQGKTKHGKIYHDMEANAGDEILIMYSKNMPDDIKIYSEKQYMPSYVINVITMLITGFFLLSASWLFILLNK